ncbi:Protein Hikeshi [Chlorella vulgaris]
MSDKDTAVLERKLQETGGGCQEQRALHLPSSIPRGVPPTVYDEVPAEQFLGPAGQHRVMKNKDGLALQTYFWPAADAKAVVLFVHGHGAHLMFEILRQTSLGQPMQYGGSWVEQWNKRGISVCGLDLQGCGRSEGKGGLRFFIERFEDYVADVLQLARVVRDEALGVTGFGRLPVFICGISLGGCIAFNAVLADQAAGEGLIQGTVLMAPMLSLEKVSRKGLNPYLRPIANLLSKLVPTAAIVATERNTLYPNIQAQWDADPLVSHSNTRVRNASEYLRITEASMQRLEEFQGPLLLFHSENDTMSEDKALRLVNHMWHIMVREEGNEKINAEIADSILLNKDLDVRCGMAFAVFFTGKSTPIASTSFVQTDPTHWVLDATSTVLPDYHDLKEIALFLTAQGVLPPDMGLALYVSIGGADWSYRGFVSNTNPSDVLPLSWPDPPDGVPPGPRPPGFAQIGVSLEPLAALQEKLCSKLGSREDFAKRVGLDLFNFMQSFGGVQAVGGDKLLVPANILDHWYARLSNRLRRDPDWLTRQRDAI